MLSKQIKERIDFFKMLNFNVLFPLEPFSKMEHRAKGKMSDNHLFLFISMFLSKSPVSECVCSESCLRVALLSQSHILHWSAELNSLRNSQRAKAQLETWCTFNSRQSQNKCSAVKSQNASYLNQKINHQTWCVSSLCKYKKWEVRSGW